MNSWDKLSMAERAEIMKIAIEGGVYDLDAIRSGYNEYANGGKIHIAPSKRGTFTAAASKHGKSVQAFASQVLAHKENYSPAMVKKANFARNASKWKHAHGGELGTYYDGWGDTWNFLKSGAKKIRQKVEDLGLHKSPGQHIAEIFTPIPESDLGILPTMAVNISKKLGIDNITRGNDDDAKYRQNLYNTVDPTSEIPNDTKSIIGYGLSAVASKLGSNMPYHRTHTDSVADAAWAKRLGLEYNQNALIDNGDGTVRLPIELENEIPTDTLAIKERIANNEKRLKRVRGKEHQLTREAVDIDKQTLEALRKTYSTGEPVMMDEHSHVSRNWQGLTPETVGPTPLNTLHRYIVQYDKDNNRMKYWDWYDFNEFEDFVPGKPYKIQGSIDLKKKK